MALRIVAPESITGRVLGHAFQDGVAFAPGPLSRPVSLHFATHGFTVGPVGAVYPAGPDAEPEPDLTSDD